VSPVAKTFWSKLGLLLVAFYAAFREISPFYVIFKLATTCSLFFQRAHHAKSCDCGVGIRQISASSVAQTLETNGV
jgi:fatty acid desaturase